MIIGTAGHIDHGKTALVKALTGVDADRLPEEKARGITLDLGFAYTPRPDGSLLGFIDVPGHEKLIHTMLAGAAGIDYVLLVVAADDGVMPQTREHLQVIDLLGLARGAIVISKTDRVDAARVDAVAATLRALAADTALAGAPVFPVSAVSGTGVDALRQHLENAAQRERSDGMQFRLAIDRAFTLPGAGIIVTGTVYAGSVAAGDQLLLSPLGTSVRVRSIHAQNRVAERGHAGERCGVNIVAPQLSKDDIERGQWLLAPALHRPTQRIDACVRLLADARSLPHWAPVHVHLAAAHALAHVVPLEAQTLASGTSALVQLVLDKPIGALNGDRLVLRDAAAQRTIGGGVVLDCNAPARQRKTLGRLAALRAVEHGSPRERLRQAAALAPLGIDVLHFCLSWNVDPNGLRPLPDELQEIGGGGAAQVFVSAAWHDLKQRALQLLSDFHLTQPDELGLDATRLRRMLAPQLRAAVCGALIDELLAAGALTKTGPWLHLPEHSVELQPAERELADRALSLLNEHACDPPWVRELAQTLNIEETRARLLMLRLARRAEVFQVTRDLFYSRGAIANLAKIARALEQRDGAIRAASFRDAIQIGRKRAIQILEFFDRIGYTRRAGEAHRVRSESLLHLTDETYSNQAAHRPGADC
jgi:selenocysteine-specific elongation factor